MIDVNSVKLHDILPSSLSADKTISDIIKSLDGIFSDIDKEIELIKLYENLDSQPTEVLDLLAWQYHVDFYDYSYSDDVKRNLIRQSIAWHRRKGTPSAVEDMVTTIYSSAEVQEWWEYGGQPFHFKVNIYGEEITDPVSLNNLRDSVYAVKNARSVFDGFEFYASKGATTTPLYVAFAPGMDHTEITVKATPVSPVKVGVGALINEEVVVHG